MWMTNQQWAYQILSYSNWNTWCPIFNCLAYDWMVKYAILYRWKFIWHDSLHMECCYMAKKDTTNLTCNFNYIFFVHWFLIQLLVILHFIFMSNLLILAVYYAAVTDSLISSVKYFKTKEGLYFKWIMIFTI